MKKELYNAAHNALKICMALQPKEKLLVIFDAPEKQIGEALFVAGQELGAETLAIQIPELEFNGQEPPEEVAKLMQQMHAVICPTSKSLTHTDARRNACKANARVATMPNIQLETMIRGMSADYHRIASLSDKVAEILTAGNEAHLTTPKGTDIIIPIKDIEAIFVTGTGDAGRYIWQPALGRSIFNADRGSLTGQVYCRCIDGQHRQNRPGSH
jgi:leucyl aminopeptidase (aminopeptidase T)